jgi:hypothetical protein
MDLERITMADYKAATGEWLTSHLLADFRRSPAIYRARLDGAIPREESTAMALGTAAHTLILEGLERFSQQYAVGDGPVNPRTGKPYGRDSKAYQDWASEQDAPVLGIDEAAELQSMAHSVRQHPVASRLLATRDATIEGVGRVEMHGIKCQVRPDWWHPTVGIVDLKTIDDLDWWPTQARRYGYLHQVAFYAAVTNALTSLWELPRKRPTCRFVVVEKAAPYRVGVYRVSDQLLADTVVCNHEHLVRLRECRARNEWPTGYEIERIWDFD